MVGRGRIITSALLVGLVQVRPCLPHVLRARLAQQRFAPWPCRLTLYSSHNMACLAGQRPRHIVAVIRGLHGPLRGQGYAPQHDVDRARSPNAAHGIQRPGLVDHLPVVREAD